MNSNEGNLPAQPNTIWLAKQTAVVCVVVGLFAVLVLGIASAIDVLLMVFAGLCFALFLHTMADSISQRSGLGATASLVVVLVLLTLIVVATRSRVTGGRGN